MERLTKLERETHIWFNDLEPDAIIETCNKKLIKALDSRCKDYPESYSMVSETSYLGDQIKTYSCKKNLIKFGKKIAISEEHRNKLVQSGKKLQANRKDGNKEVRL